MKYFVALAAIIAFACAAQEGDLVVRFNLSLFGAGKTFFYKIPRDMDGVIAEGWTKQPRADDHLPGLEMYCAEGNTFCAFFDDTKYVAGVQVALRQDKYTDSVFDWKIQGFTEWEPANDGIRYWTIQQYYVDEKFLEIDANQRISCRDKHKTLQMDSIWVRSINGELLKIASAEEGIKNSEFTVQACLPWMGTHYYYNMSATTECTSEAMIPWFPLVNDGELIGTGFVTFGKMNLEDGERDWLEKPNRLAVQTIVPRGPKCLYDLSDNPGLVTMHIYYIKNPQRVLCIF